MTTNELLYTDIVMLPINEFPFITEAEIDGAIALITGFTIDELREKDRSGEKNQARQIGILFYYLFGYSYENSGMKFHRDHSTAMHACKKIRTYYGQPCEGELTSLVNQMTELTGLKL